MAEDERERITKRANGGRQAAKARGVKFGRKAKLTQHQIEIARQRMQAGESARSIAQAAAERSDEILMLPSVQCYNVALYSGEGNSGKWRLGRGSECLVDVLKAQQD